MKCVMTLACVGIADSCGKGFFAREGLGQSESERCERGLAHIRSACLQANC